MNIKHKLLLKYRHRNDRIIMKIIWLIVLVVITFCQPHSDKVIGLIPEYNHSWYSGFLNVSEDKALHYVFFESQHDSQNDPLIVWIGSELGYSALHAMAY